jgi:hypothetical protein
LVSFNKFDSNIGTLTSVTLTLNANMTAEVDVINQNAVNEHFTNATASVPISVTGPDSSVITATPAVTPFGGTAVPGTNAYTNLQATASATESIVNSNFGYYSAASGGTANLTALVNNGTFTGTGPRNVYFGGLGTVSETITLTYNYAHNPGSVPEPNSAVLCAAGVLASLGSVIRRRKLRVR